MMTIFQAESAYLEMQTIVNRVFVGVRAHNAWLDRPVDDTTLRTVYDVLKHGLTSANCSPARFVFVKSTHAKDLLKPALVADNVEAVTTAPVSAIVGVDLAFYRHLPRLFKQADARSRFVGNEGVAREAALFNGTLQAAYLIIAARAVGLDVGPTEDFDRKTVDAAFFAGTAVTSRLIVNLGYGDASRLPAENIRLDFSEVASIV